MAIAVVQTKMGIRTNVSIGTNPINSLATDGNTAAGNRVVVLASVAFGAATNIPTLTISDSQGLTWTPFGGTAQGRVRQYGFLSSSTSAAALTVEITADSVDTTTAVGLDQCIVEISGSSGYESDGNAAANSADGNSGNVTLAGNGISVAGITGQGATTITEPGSPWVFIGESESETCSYVYKISTGGTETATWTFTSRNWAGVNVGLAEAAGGSSVVPISRYRRISQGVA